MNIKSINGIGIDTMVIHTRGRRTRRGRVKAVYEDNGRIRATVKWMDFFVEGDTEWNKYTGSRTSTMDTDNLRKAAGFK